MSYTYEPAQIAVDGVSRMRFELGDTLVEGGAETAYLSDQEITVITAAAMNWLDAKLRLARGVYHKLAYEVSTRVGPVSFDLQQRAERWKTIVEELELQAAQEGGISDAAVSAIKNGMGKRADTYFRTGMQQNPRTVDWRRR